jgi:GT2 family glycosyltransferase
MNAQSIYPEGFIIQEFICFYATLIPRTVWNKVGPLDHKFQTGQDDLDYCLRAQNLKIPSMIAIDSLIWHFGGATADLSLTPQIRQENVDYYTKKWGRLPA